MKKGIKSLLVVLALATAFVCAMAVATFASEDLYTYGNGEWTARMSTKTEYNGVRHNHATEPWRNHGADYGLYNELVKTDYLAPQCEVPGHAAYWYCKGCGYYFSDAWGKNLIGGENDLAAWLDEGGEGYVEPLGHEWGEYHEEFIFGKGWMHVQRCTHEGCGLINSHSAHESAYDGWTVHESKSLDGEMRHDRVCSVCGLRDRYSAENHNAKDFIVPVGGKPATCGDAGFREAYLCTKCELYFEDADGTILIGDKAAYNAWIAEGGEGYLAPHGNHRWDKGVVQKDGSTLYTCEVCGATKVEKGVATGDTENMGLWMMLAIASMVAAGYAVSRKEN